MIITLLSTTSCAHDEDIILEEHTKQTVIMFFPWSTNLLSYFRQNIRDFAESIEKGVLKNERVIVCLSSSPYTAELFELKYERGKCITDTLKHYKNQSFTTCVDITEMLIDVKSVSPAERYGLIIGCHGMGWLPVKQQTKAKNLSNIFHYDIQGVPMTRYFGGLTSEFQIETKVLAEGIANSGMKMEYILFDDCYMSTIEVAYDLKDVTDYLIACPTEVLVYGFPYHKCGEFLVGNVDYKSVVDAFYNFYSQYIYPYGTVAVTDCREIDRLALIVSQINTIRTIEDKDIDNIQIMDGYTPAIFLDFGDYISKICSDPVLINEFFFQLDKLVPFKCHTEKYYSAFKGELPISTFSGITTSEPSTNNLSSSVHLTEWYKATH